MFTDPGPANFAEAAVFSLAGDRWSDRTLAVGAGFACNPEKSVKEILTTGEAAFDGFLEANYAFRNFSIASNPFVRVSIDAAKLRRT